MTEEVVTVTRKGQVTIPIRYRRKYEIMEGTKLMVREESRGILFSPLIPLEELAGADAGKISLLEAKKKLDEMRSQDRY